MGDGKASRKKGPLVPVKPQPSIYTLMIVVAIIVLAVTVGMVMWNLMASPPDGYGLTFGQLFSPVKELIPGK